MRFAERHHNKDIMTYTGQIKKLLYLRKASVARSLRVVSSLLTSFFICKNVFALHHSWIFLYKTTFSLLSCRDRPTGVSACTAAQAGCKQLTQVRSDWSRPSRSSRQSDRVGTMGPNRRPPSRKLSKPRQRMKSSRVALSEVALFRKVHGCSS
jgi:hypothetical protein